ncbi:MAG: NAD-dependent deacylase [Deltaproteobacteria bacterium]|nr:NAD-dependent deacylase [Deltaproteobacteria bacterium]
MIDDNSELFKEKFRQAKDMIAAAGHPVVLTGAGISAESGVPTFRGEGGLWKQYNVFELATPEAFTRDPALVWEFYNWRRELLAKCRCNPAHLALVKMEQRFSPAFTLITQNVDGLHTQAGSRNILEIHGNLWQVRCLRCGRLDTVYGVFESIPPKCDQCGGMLRPNVVWFGEALDPQVLGAATAAAESCDLMLVIGTSAVVQPAASLAILAKKRGAGVIEINLEETDHTGRLDITLLGKAGEIVPGLMDGL